MEGFYHLGLLHLGRADHEGNALQELQEEHTRAQALAALKKISSGVSSNGALTSTEKRRLKQMRVAQIAANSEESKRERAVSRVQSMERRQAQRRAESHRRKQQVTFVWVCVYNFYNFMIFVSFPVFLIYLTHFTLPYPLFPSTRLPTSHESIHPSIHSSIHPSINLSIN
jgi:hypothetical protein